MEKPLVRYFQVWSPYYQKAKCNQKTRIPVTSSDRSSLSRQKNDKHQPNRNRWGATHLTHKAIL